MGSLVQNQEMGSLVQDAIQEADMRPELECELGSLERRGKEVSAQCEDWWQYGEDELVQETNSPKTPKLRSRNPPKINRNPSLEP